MAATARLFLGLGLHAYYGESYIVQGVSFNMREGEILALLGRNGAGKTSTLRAIARVDDPEAAHGEIWLDHQPLHEMKSYPGGAQRHRSGAGRPAHHSRA
jgi:branched-chain amino acid transport system ATP-binding protein